MGWSSTLDTLDTYHEFLWWRFIFDRATPFSDIDIWKSPMGNGIFRNRSDILRQIDDSSNRWCQGRGWSFRWFWLRGIFLRSGRCWNRHVKTHLCDRSLWRNQPRVVQVGKSANKTIPLAGVDHCPRPADGLRKGYERGQRGPVVVTLLWVVDYLRVGVHRR